MPLYAGKHAICAFLRNMRNMLRSHVRYKPVSLNKDKVIWQKVESLWQVDPTTRMYSPAGAGELATIRNCMFWPRIQPQISASPRVRNRI